MKVIIGPQLFIVRAMLFEFAFWTLTRNITIPHTVCLLPLQEKPKDLHFRSVSMNKSETLLVKTIPPDFTCASWTTLICISIKFYYKTP